MKIKTKLTLGVGFLFLLILLISIVGVFNINALKADTGNILTANYNSLEYCRNMLEALEGNRAEDMKVIELNLSAQEKNNTEAGEAELTQMIRNDFNAFKENKNDSLYKKTIRGNLFAIMKMNMVAIEQKSKVAETTADKAVFWIVVTGTLCFLMAFTLFINLPSHISRPIRELTESIGQIAAKKYSERVHLEGHSEFRELAKSFNIMAEKLEEYNNSNLATLMIEKKRIETLINNMHDPVIGLDEQLKVIFANEESIRISGLAHHEFIGHSAKDLALKNDLIRSLIKDIVLGESNDEAKTGPIKIYTNNREGYFEKELLPISITPTGESTQRLIGHVIFLRNVTAYKELDTAKTNFIATVSHEFKTPIASIKMGLQLLENDQIGKLNNEQKKLLDGIHDDVNLLLKITGELLNMTQVESGNIQLNLVPSKPENILKEAISATKALAEQRQIQFNIESPDQVSDVMADPEKTTWVLTNLISNAIRYSYEHSVIYLRIYETPEKILFSVKDTGQGIAPMYLDKIFDRYFRVPGTKKEGTGLGLAISKEFMQAQGGEITVESEFGAWSIFTLSLNKVV
jgi:signal transduction histidine kinase